jgi:hypothetical protein
MREKRLAMVFPPGAQGQAQSASNSSKRRIGTIAAALAKAQAQLVNPEKWKQ